MPGRGRPPLTKEQKELNKKKRDEAKAEAKAKSESEKSELLNRMEFKSEGDIKNFLNTLTQDELTEWVKNHNKFVPVTQHIAKKSQNTKASRIKSFINKFMTNKEQIKPLLTDKEKAKQKLNEILGNNSLNDWIESEAHKLDNVSLKKQKTIIKDNLKILYPDLNTVSSIQLNKGEDVLKYLQKLSNDVESIKKKQVAGGKADTKYHDELVEKAKNKKSITTLADLPEEEEEEEVKIYTKEEIAKAKAFLSQTPKSYLVEGSGKLSQSSRISDEQEILKKIANKIIRQEELNDEEKKIKEDKRTKELFSRAAIASASIDSGDIGGSGSSGSQTKTITRTRQKQLKYDPEVIEKKESKYDPEVIEKKSEREEREKKEEKEYKYDPEVIARDYKPETKEQKEYKERSKRLKEIESLIKEKERELSIVKEQIEEETDEDDDYEAMDTKKEQIYNLTKPSKGAYINPRYKQKLSKLKDERKEKLKDERKEFHADVISYLGGDDEKKIDDIERQQKQFERLGYYRPLDFIAGDYSEFMKKETILDNKTFQKTINKTPSHLQYEEDFKHNDRDETINRQNKFLNPEDYKEDEKPYGQESINSGKIIDRIEIYEREIIDELQKISIK